MLLLPLLSLFWWFRGVIWYVAIWFLCPIMSIDSHLDLWFLCWDTSGQFVFCCQSMTRALLQDCECEAVVNFYLWLTFWVSTKLIIYEMWNCISYIFFSSRKYFGHNVCLNYEDSNLISIDKLNSLKSHCHWNFLKGSNFEWHEL